MKEPIEIIQHPRLGILELSVNSRARRFTFRATEKGLRVTLPPFSSKKDLYECIDSMEPKLQRLLEKKSAKSGVTTIMPGFSIKADGFEVVVKEDDVDRPTARLWKGVLTITCKPMQTYDNEELQSWFVRVIEESLRYMAKRVLVPRLDALAKDYGFKYTKVSIHKTHGRWGSCSTRKNINLSIYLMLLPARLRDYVILHELCHTVEMNHGPRFWDKLNAVTGGKAESLRMEMRSYDTSVFCLQKRIGV